MAFLLEHFDLRFPPELLLMGEQLYDNKAIVNAEEVEKNLWSYEVKDGAKFEIEILIAAKKVSSFSCDCDTFKSDKECKHVIACLYDLRYTKTKPISAGPRIIRSVPKKLSIPNILNQIDAEELKSFVRNYSKKNKKFSTALKASFARKVEIENNEEKYESILNSIVKPATEVNHKISFQSIKQFQAIASQFDAQFEDSVSLKQYTEAYYIIKSLLSKVSYVNHWTASENPEILRIAKHFHKQFRLLMELEIAPSLLQEMIAFGLELAARSYYHVSHSEHNLLLTLLEPPGLKSRQEELVSILQRKLNSALLHEEELEKLWIIRQYFVEKNIDLRKEKTPALSSQSVYRIVERLLEFKAFQGLYDFLQLFKVNGQIKDLFLAKSLTKVLKKIGSKEELMQTAHRSLLFFKDIYFYNQIKITHPQSSVDFFEMIRSELSTKKQFDNQKLYLDLLEVDDRIDELIDFLLNSRYALRHIYDRAKFIKKNSSRLAEVLIALSDRYLSEFLGKESSNEMRKLLIFLRKNDWETEMNKLQRHLLKDYEDRKSLQIEIQDF